MLRTAWTTCMHRDQVCADNNDAIWNCSKYNNWRAVSIDQTNNCGSNRQENNYTLVSSIFVFCFCIFLFFSKFVNLLVPCSYHSSWPEVQQFADERQRCHQGVRFWGIEAERGIATYDRNRNRAMVNMEGGTRRTTMRRKQKRRRSGRGGEGGSKRKGLGCVLTFSLIHFRMAPEVALNEACMYSFLAWFLYWAFWFTFIHYRQRKSRCLLIRSCAVGTSHVPRALRRCTSPPSDCYGGTRGVSSMCSLLFASLTLKMS